jgi:hypothetical protein
MNGFTGSSPQTIHRKGDSPHRKFTANNSPQAKPPQRKFTAGAIHRRAIHRKNNSPQKK